MAANFPTYAASAKLRTSALIARWVLQLLLAAQFLSGGLLKLIGDTAMVDLFIEIGVGQWLRYLVGLLELAGAVGLLVPRLAALAALGLACLMAGAVVTNVLIGTNPAFPGALLLITGLIAHSRRAQLSRRLQPGPAKE